MSTEKVRVATVGVFDILSAPHLELLQAAKRQGDILLVIVVPDWVVVENKGAKPVNSLEVRVKQLLDIDEVDFVVVDCESMGYLTLMLFKPNVVVFGYDQRRSTDDKLIKRLNAANILPQVVRVETRQRIHSSQTKQKVLEAVLPPRKKPKKSSKRK